MSAPAQTRTAGPPWTWIIARCLWLLPIFFFHAGFAWIGFLIAGAMERSRRLLVIAGVYGAVGIVLGFADWNGWGDVVADAVRIVAIVHALIELPRHLDALWTNATARPAASAAPSASRREPQRGASSSRRRRRQRRAEVPTEAAPLVAAADAERNRLVATDAPAEPAPAPTVDVNTASRRRLGRLPGMNAQRARTATEERDRRGGFADLAEFSAVLGMQPHEFARLREVAFCSPRPRGKLTDGRRLDL